MNRNRVPVRVAAVLLAVLSAAGVAGCAADRPTGDPATAAQTAFPGLATPTGEPDLPSLASMHPGAGTVGQAAGPFDERFVWDKLAFDKGAVRGVARVTSDVSEILELIVVAGFYDAQGNLIGTARWTHHLDESHEAGHTDHVAPDDQGAPDEGLRFTIRVPEDLRNRAVSAAVGVPVLVNE